MKWVGRARWNFGSFYLWGDVPALMPAPQDRDGIKAGGDWFGRNGDYASRNLVWHDSVRRAAAVAMSAKIPGPISRHIAAVFR